MNNEVVKRYIAAIKIRKDLEERYAMLVKEGERMSGALVHARKEAEDALHAMEAEALKDRTA